ncbi:hypothetical protein SNE40_003695 [Patella caerulea]
MLRKETDFEVRKMKEQCATLQKEKDFEIKELKDQIKELEKEVEKLREPPLEDPQQTTTTSFTDLQQTTTTSFTDPQQTTTTSLTDPQETTTTSLTDPQETTTTSFTDPQQTTTRSCIDPQQTTTTSFTDPQQITTTSFTDLQQTTTTSFTDPQQTTIINSSDKTDDGVSSGPGSKPESKYSTLHCACQYGNINDVKYLIDTGHDVNQLSDNNMSPILFCSTSQIEPVPKLTLILDKGGNIDDRDSDNNNVLHLACLYGKLESVDFILKHGVDIHSRGQYNRSPILYCCSSGIEPVAKLKLILDKGGNIEDRDSVNNNVLHRACLYGKLKTVKFLLGLGVNYNSKNKNNQKPLDCCRHSSVQSEEKVKLLEAKSSKRWFQKRS